MPYTKLFLSGRVVADVGDVTLGAFRAIDDAAADADDIGRGRRLDFGSRLAGPEIAELAHQLLARLVVGSRRDCRLEPRDLFGQQAGPARRDEVGADRDRQLIFGFLMLRSEEHTSELQSLMRISYAVFCL